MSPEIFDALAISHMAHRVAHQPSVVTDPASNGRSFDICLNLQSLRTTLRDSQRPTCSEIDSATMEALLRAVQRLAAAARTSRFHAYACVCQDLAERVADLQRGGDRSMGCLDLLCRWVDHSSRYVRHPTERSVVISLLEQMNHPAWGAPLSHAQRGVLYRALLAPSRLPVAGISVCRE